MTTRTVNKDILDKITLVPKWVNYTEAVNIARNREGRLLSMSEAIMALAPWKVGLYEELVSVGGQIWLGDKPRLLRPPYWSLRCLVNYKNGSITPLCESGYDELPAERRATTEGGEGPFLLRPIIHSMHGGKRLSISSFREPEATALVAVIAEPQDLQMELRF